MAEQDIVMYFITGALTLFGGAFMVLLKKRDDKIDDVATAATSVKDALAAHQLKSAETFATKDSMRNMFAEAVRQNKDGLDAVNKTTDEIKKDMKDMGKDINSVLIAINKKL